MPITDSTILERLNTYVTELFAPEDEALRWIQEEAARHAIPTISIAPYEGGLLQFLVRSVGARKVVEIGTLVGYSGVWIARALPPEGKLITLEKSSKHVALARASFERAGVSNRIDLREGEAQTLLEKLASEAPFDFVFIDAERASYPVFLEWAINHLRPGGMVAAHNAFRAGKVLAPQSDDDHYMINFNRVVAAETRLHSFLIGVGDGLTVGIKK